MKIIVNRENRDQNFTYQISVDNMLSFVAETDRVIVPNGRNIYLYSRNNQVIGALKEKENIFLIKKRTFHIEIDGSNFGEIVTSFNLVQDKAIAYFQGTQFEIYRQSEGFISQQYLIFRKGQQTGLVERKISNDDTDRFTAQFDRENPVVFDIFMILFIDMVWADCPQENPWMLSFSRLWRVKFEENWTPKD